MSNNVSYCFEWRPCYRSLLVGKFYPISSSSKNKLRERGNFANCLSLGSVSFVLFRRMYFITLDYHSLSEKLVAALLVTGECGAETKGDIFTRYRPAGEYIYHMPRIYISHAPSFQVNNPLSYPLRIRQLVKKIWFSHTSWFYVGRQNILPWPVD